VNFTAVKQLRDLFASSKLTSLTYEDSEFKLSLSSIEPAPQVEFAAPAESREALPEAETMRVAVTAPVVGSVYRAREPGGAPLVSLGDAVRAGDTLCVIEAMKMFSDIPAPCGGTVAEIAFTDGGLAEFGATLIVLEASE